MDGLNYILANRSQVMVLRALYKANESLTGRGVERACGLSNRSTMLALEFLVEARAVTRAETGNSYLYSLNHGHYLVSKALKGAFEAEELFWDDLRKTVRRVVRPRPMAAVATGPLAREETDYGGRLIVTMLFTTGRARIKSLGTINKLGEAIKERYGMTLEHHLLDTNTMDREEYTPLWRRVEKEGILLFGTLP
ncbi:MAG: hypothetical protein R6V03_07575 [Kiritimatiellia bacterium]